MDNVTHTLAGLTLAEAAVQLRARRTGSVPPPRLRVVAAIASMVAANLPDADLFYTGTGGDGLLYMLHHRGHTHTVLLAVLGAALLWATVGALARWRARDSPERDAGRWLLALLLVATLSHLVLDWTNSYGVHPFWPIDDRWWYGDAVFIVEPWFWVATIPALVMATGRRAPKMMLVAILVAGLVLAWHVDLVSRGAAIGLSVGTVASIALARALRPAPRIAAAIAAWVAVTLVMATGATLARHHVVRAVRAAEPNAVLLDVVVSPLPANPACTTVLTVERTGSTYRVTTARATGFPALVDAARCGSRRGADPMFEEASRASSRAVRWGSEWRAPVAELATLARASCPAHAALRFIRVPVWKVVDDSTVAVGDVRYGGVSGGFSTVVVPRRTPRCPDAVPPWIPPRADLLGAASE